MIGQLGWTSRNRALHQALLQIVVNGRVFLCQERDSFAVFASATSTTDTMRVVFDTFGHVVVDDERDVFDIDTAAGDVGGHKNILASVFETRQSVFAEVLTFATV